ncbi:hypothetical protein JTE90_015244 [Oedothorax gibbosus]|uniref:CWH43-like N-terminal domain-containing protein n=1 Tax=Oedothorax gibbosus TaxID=931172 RepID=A0AAV6TYJ6_9ARAC|nr:hypothetical protein JTE90_015244 [Oedothorax gibbosus]
MSHLVKIPFRTFYVVVASFPLLAFFSCVILSILRNFDEVTATHCQVQNYLPSISTAVGDTFPQKYIWRIGIALHCTPRFLVTLMYYKHFQNSFPINSRWQTSASAILIFQNLEITSLVGLSYISSVEDFPVHQKLFVTFVISALVSMSLLYAVYAYASNNRLYGLLSNCHDNHTSPRLEMKSTRYKFILLNVNFAAFCLSVYFYVRHNWYCEPGMYTLFALAEYFVVLSNIGYHLTAVWDFPNQYIIVGAG